MENAPIPPAPDIAHAERAFTTDDLGFTAIDAGRWRKRVGERDITFCLLRTLPELLPVEDLQRDVFGVSERDLAAASLLVSVPETGGEVIGAFLDVDTAPDPRLVGFAVGWGGFMAGRPRLLSDMLGVDARSRGFGLGAAIKALQAAICLEQGTEEIVWTVDPLRAANARLNFEKLGAIADRYEENRYGVDFGAGLNGGLPTDRLHVTWHLTGATVRDRLLGRAERTTLADVANLDEYDPNVATDRALILFPADFDRLVARDREEALAWRHRLRRTLPLAFAQGYRITGCVGGVDPERHLAAYLIER